MNPQEKAAARARLLEERKAIEAKIVSLKEQIAAAEAVPKQDTQGSEVGDEEPMDNIAELHVMLEEEEANLLTNATDANKYAGRRKSRRPRRKSRRPRRKARKTRRS